MTGCTKDENATKKNNTKNKELKNQPNIYVCFNKRQEVFPDPSPQRGKNDEAKPSLRKKTNQKANSRLDLKEHLVTSASNCVYFCKSYI